LSTNNINIAVNLNTDNVGLSVFKFFGITKLLRNHLPLFLQAIAMRWHVGKKLEGKS
jgi:hypothetical protein